MMGVRDAGSREWDGVCVRVLVFCLSRGLDFKEDFKTADVVLQLSRVIISHEKAIAGQKKQMAWN